MAWNSSSKEKAFVCKMMDYKLKQYSSITLCWIFLDKSAATGLTGHFLAAYKSIFYYIHYIAVHTYLESVLDRM